MSASWLRCQGLVRIAEHPQRQGGMDETGDANIMPVERPQGAVLLGVIEGDPLLQVGVGSDELAQRFAGCPEGMMGA